jgi:hypothetical protein
MEELNMKKIFLFLLIPFLTLSQERGGGMRSGSAGIKIVQDTSAVAKTLGKIYFYTGDSTLYQGMGTYLEAIPDSAHVLSMIADSAKWTAVGDTLIPQGGKKVKVQGLRVTGNVKVDGQLTMRTTAFSRIKGIDGTSALPMYSFITDSTTGLYHDASSAGGLSLSTRATQRIFVSKGGRVEVGSTTSDTTGQMNIVTSGSAIGLNVDGNKTSGNLAQFINDNNGAVGDSSVTISKLGIVSLPDGATATPALTFVGDATSGISRNVTTGSLVASERGVQALAITKGQKYNFSPTASDSANGVLNLTRNKSTVPLLHISNDATTGSTVPDSTIQYDDSGELRIGTVTDDSKTTTGLVINQQANDDNIITLKSSDVNHGITVWQDTDTYFAINKVAGVAGGSYIQSLNDAGSVNAFQFLGIQGGTSTTATNTKFLAAKKTTTTIQALAATEVAFDWGNYGNNTSMTILGSGYVGVGTVTPKALLHGNNQNVWSKPLLRLGRDKDGTGATVSDSVVLSVTGSGKLSFSDTPADTFNQIQITSRTSGKGSGLVLTSSQWNKSQGTALAPTLASQAQSADTSAIGLYIRSDGRAGLKLIGINTDSISAYLTSTGSVLQGTANGTSFSNNRRQFYFGPDTLALFNGAKTGRDSTVTILPNGYLGVNKIPATAVDVTGGITASGSMTAGNFVTPSYSRAAAFVNTTSVGLYADADNNGTTDAIVFGRGAYTGAPVLEYARFLFNGYFGVGTTAPAALFHINNANVLSKPLFRLGRDKNSTPDSVTFMVTGMGKVSISPNTNTYGMAPADTLNLVNIIGKKSTDSLFVVYNDIVGRDSLFAVKPTGGISTREIDVASGESITVGSVVWDVAGTDSINGAQIGARTISNLALPSLAGDVTGTLGANVVGDDSHDHTTTISGKAANVSDADLGDVTITGGAWAVEDNSHNHTTLSSTLTVGTTSADSMSFNAGIFTVNNDGAASDEKIAVFRVTAGERWTVDEDGDVVQSASLDVGTKVVVGDSLRVEETLRAKGVSTFGVTGTVTTIGTDGKVTVGASNAGVSAIDTVFTAGFVPRWLKITSGSKVWFSPIYAAADTLLKW